VRRLTGTRSLVAITGLTHDLQPAYPDDIFTWALTFIDAELRRDANALVKLQRMTSVAGGAEDVRRIDYIAPQPETGDERMVIEFFHQEFGHYFVTAEAAEAAALDAGSPPGWKRTGLAFKAIDANAMSGLPDCRFFGVFGSVSTHFYTINADECAGLMTKPPWEFESYAFRADAAVNDDCPTDRMRVQRVYNNSIGGAPNHRYTTSANEAASLDANGWIVEGAVFCTPP
jgi:hypothetical protein